MIRTNLLTGSAVFLAIGLSVAPTFADPIERYAELQAVGEAINDPDPLMRLALLEEIIAKGDATEVQLAIRTAFSIDDPNIRSLALRTHFASFRTVVVTAELPQEMKAVLEGSDEKAISSLRNKYGSHFSFMDRIGGVFKFRTEYVDPSDTEFTIFSLNQMTEPKDTHSGKGNIKGAVIVLQSGIRLNYDSRAYSCTFELSDYSAFTVRGTGSCDFDETMPFPVTLHLFEPVEEQS